MKYVNYRNIDDNVHKFIQTAAIRVGKTAKDFYMEAAIKAAEETLGESLKDFVKKLPS